MYFYKRTEFSPFCLYTVGTQDPLTGQFLPESDHETEQGAASRVSFLNGGASEQTTSLLREAYYHLHTLRLIEAADPRLPNSEGLDETYLEIKKLLSL